MFPWYRLVLALHIIAVICWMAGILYLIRLFVYHAAETESVVKERFKVMERKLYRMITLPGMLVALVMGIIMLVMNPGLLHEAWMHAKLFFVVCLIGVTHYSGAMVKRLEKGETPHTERFFRIFNEVPTLLMILIVIMVILRPF